MAFGFAITMPLGCMSPPTRYFTFFAVNPQVLAHRYNARIENTTGKTLYDGQRLDEDLVILPDVYRIGMSGLLQTFNYHPYSCLTMLSFSMLSVLLLEKTKITSFSTTDWLTTPVLRCVPGGLQQQRDPLHKAVSAVLGSRKHYRRRHPCGGFAKLHCFSPSNILGLLYAKRHAGHAAKQEPPRQFRPGLCGINNHFSGRCAYRLMCRSPYVLARATGLSHYCDRPCPA